ncbi:putative bifunctional diguanylate cyclase/phosphodiesterase [Variibacter gotjawalensis]|uniref:putative bifunctional diguanylate cyclase/phosphodiesterase n=1 Tax=Variibacter gotjawalensis TaxID=1333996 RepID=UPI00102C4DAC|nr:bifunctional diguanylate cyclase/phosphodiesterase [Variibacter gotjawalensis]NIK47865.1 diguanylate cyclase (GGDEF)-like protein [Variibacter gotjawalensis]
MVYEHNLWLVALAAAVCIFGSWISFGLFERACEREGAQQYGWSFLTAIAAGASVWCMHFIAMLSYEIAVPAHFDPTLTMVSLFVAVVGCSLGFGVGAVKRSQFAPELCGAVVGLSIAIMHYTGMIAYRVSGIIEWNFTYIAASVIYVIAASSVALSVAVRVRSKLSQPLAIALFVMAIVGLHFVGMTALEITPLTSDGAVNERSVGAMAVAIAGVGFLVLGTGAASYLIDERTSGETVRRLRRLALFDTLTSLPNRAHFSECLAAELAKAAARDGKLAVIVVDLNNFKELNDLRGHLAGDKLLAEIGARLSTLVDVGKFIARVGGDEFAAVQRFETVGEINGFARLIDSALSAPFYLDGFETRPSAAIGISLYPSDGIEAPTLVSNADFAMYRAKNQSDSRICFYKKEMDEASRERVALRGDLKRAIESKQFVLNYQVQACVNSGEMTGAEALIRWHHHERGLILPDSFIPLAEETGLIIEIGDWVLRTSCKAAAASGVKVAVNVSAVQLTRANFAHRVHAILVESGLSPSLLELEITETALIADKTGALHALRSLRALGVGIAIDDFGAGYSSIETLRTFPFSKIKLDRAFTRDLEHDHQAIAILRAVVALGKGLNITVLAEGIETRSQLDIIRREGCDEAQGFLFGRPVATICSEYTIAKRELQTAV